MPSLNDKQPSPVRTSEVNIWDLVIADMRDRDNLGYRLYGGPMTPHDGRDSLVDAYQEALDLAVHLRKAIEERNGPPVAS